MVHEAAVPVAEATIDIKAQRAAFGRGFRALKARLADLVASQLMEKQALGLPRKTPEQRASLKLALDATPSGKRYPGSLTGVGYVQMCVQLRKVSITAALILHAEVRGKVAPHKVDKYDKGQYNVCRADAEKVFKEAVQAGE